MPAPETVRNLVQRFTDQLDTYRSGRYNETQLRSEFLNPFFEALGWDVFNKNGYAETYKDVVHEDSLEVEGANKAPDYSFRVGGQRKFFVEAKKPSVHILSDIHPAFQLRRYAWSAHLPLGILTDFEELAIYDCRSRPDKTDKASTGRVAFYTFQEYLDKWDELAAIFSREAVYQGAFDQYAEGVKGKKGTTEVDDAFLAEIEAWRDLLAHNFALRNPSLTSRELNHAVQMTIDRIIFLRICEDRGIEPYGRLLEIAKQKDIYAGLCQAFVQADTRYNSGLFHFKSEKGASSAADSLSLTLGLDDKPLRGMLAGLYYPESPYVFSVISSDILGQVYERFLGKVIRLTAGHQAKVEEKPEVRKAGGVYYTPTYIVDYIVKNTVGRLLEGKTPGQVAELKIVDPACGSGTFLLGAYQCLLDWHLEWYSQHDPEKSARGAAPVLFEGEHGWRLTTSEKKRILLNNIHGVDIDPEAVEVSKLSLSLKVLEGENQESIGAQLRLFQERALPDLGNNIQCGNSLIGPDYYEGRQLTLALADEDERYRVNAFDWQAAFPQVFRQGGFDAVIGNPPWGAEFDIKSDKYFKNIYQVAKSPAIDSYALFIEKGIHVLNNKGLIGYITPDTFLRKRDLINTRSLLLKNTTINELIETGPVFSQVRDTWCLVFIAENKIPSDNSKIHHRKISRFIKSSEERLHLFELNNWTSESVVYQKTWSKNPELIVGYLASEVDQKIIEKIRKHPVLEEFDNIFRVSRGEEGSKFALIPDPQSNFLMLIPNNIERYYCENGLQVNENSLTKTKKENFYKHPKIWIIRIQKMRWVQRIVCSFDERLTTAGMKTLQIITSTNDNSNDLKYLSAILSSKLINYWCINFLADDMNQAYLSKIPIPRFINSNNSYISQYEALNNFTNKMLSLHKQSRRTPQEQELLKREIESTDRAIDRLVYELYGLTEEEIRKVEGSNLIIV